MSQASVLVSVNGVSGAALSPLDRGLAYGDGLFETCLVRAGCVSLWPWHKARLLGSAVRLQLPLSLERLYACMQALFDGQSPDGVLKILVTRGEGGRGYRLPAEPDPTYCLLFYPDIPSTQAGVVAHFCRQRLADNPGLAGLKHLNRLEQVLARAEWPASDDSREGLLLDGAGQVIEATASNLFAVFDGQLVTPDLSHCGVAGILRQLICEQLAPSLGLTVKSGKLLPDDLLRAEELFLCNSLRGIWPILGLECPPRAWVPGPVTRDLQAALTEFLQRPVLPREVCPWNG